jgi:IS30 family transposase
MDSSSHKYKLLSTPERIKIETLNNLGLSVRQIAGTIARSPSTISRELRRGRYKAKYHAHIAQKRTNRGHRACKANDQNIMQKIETLIKRRWSPEIISHELGGAISHTTIYTMIKTIRPEWRKYLIYQKKIRYHKGKAGKSLIPYRTDISDRPAEVRFGDFEADTVVSARGGQACIGVFVERATRLYKIVKMKNKSSVEMLRASLQALRLLDVRSITYDNGSENAYHWVTNKLLGCASYFCRPYRSGDKGLVENRNRWLRVWLPKGSKFDLITDEELSRIEKEINERPMKCLGWLSPIQAFHNTLPLQFNL